MAGFLDKNTRIIDMVLTDHGKKLYSQGKLEFKYYALSDEGVDYDPFISNSGSLTPTQLSASKIEQIEATLVREATFGLENGLNNAAKDETNIKDLLFTMPQGQTILPKMKFSPELSSGSITINQTQLIDSHVTVDTDGNRVSHPVSNMTRGFEKAEQTRLDFDLSINDFFDEQSLSGFDIKVFESGSDGLIEVKPKDDLRNHLSFNCDMKMFRGNQIKDTGNSDDEKIIELEKSVGFSRGDND